MNYCENCGGLLAGSKKFCPECGCVTAESITPGQACHHTQGNTQNLDGVLDKIQNDNTVLMSVLSYIFILIPLLTGAHKTSDVIKFHLNQGAVLVISSFLWGIIRATIGIGFSYVHYYYSWMILAPLNLLGVVFPVLLVIGVLNAVNGKMKPLPLIGRISIIK